MCIVYITLILCAQRISWITFMRYDQGQLFVLYFGYIVAVSFIGGGNRSTRKKP